MLGFILFIFFLLIPSSFSWSSSSTTHQPRKKKFIIIFIKSINQLKKSNSISCSSSSFGSQEQSHSMSLSPPASSSPRRTQNKNHYKPHKNTTGERFWWRCIHPSNSTRPLFLYQFLFTRPEPILRNCSKGQVLGGERRKVICGDLWILRLNS